MEATVNFKFIDFSGKIIWKETKDMIIMANTNLIVAEIPVNMILSGISRKEILFYVSILKEDEIISDNIYYFNPPKYLTLPIPKIDSSIKKAKEGAEIILKTDKLAKNVYLTSETEGFFSDNYFDLLPGECKKIKFSCKENSFDYKKDIKIISLTDTYSS
jgi:beta-mannosidase